MFKRGKSDLGSEWLGKLSTLHCGTQNPQGFPISATIPRSPFLNNFRIATTFNQMREQRGAGIRRRLAWRRSHAAGVIIRI
jgi:hypothetical protein